MNWICKCPLCGEYTESPIQYDEDGPYYVCENCGAESTLDPELVEPEEPEEPEELACCDSQNLTT